MSAYRVDDANRVGRLELEDRQLVGLPVCLEVNHIANRQRREVPGEVVLKRLLRALQRCREALQKTHEEPWWVSRTVGRALSHGAVGIDPGRVNVRLQPL